MDKKTKELRFLSVSAMSTADPGEGGCLRKWHYQFMLGRKPPQSKAQEAGVEGHAQIEGYLRTGVKALGSRAIRGLHFVPDPGPDLLIEWDVLWRPGQENLPITAENSAALLKNAVLRANGVPVLGFIDLAHSRGTNKGTDNLNDMVDPKGTAEVCDWKFVGGDKYLKTPAELRKAMQMVGYGKWVYAVRPETTMVRLSHGYFVETGRSRKVTTLVGREEIDRAWEHADGVARSIGHAAKETDVDKVDFNLDACDSYGGCMHRLYCTAGMDTSLAAVMGATASKALLPVSNSQGIIPVPSLLKAIQAKNATPPPSAPPPSAVAIEQERLAMEEKMARLRSLVPAGFQEACDKVRAFNQGFPKLVGSAAIAFAAMGGQDVAPGFEVPGVGLRDYVVLDSPEQMAQLVVDLAEDAAQNPVVSPIPPDAPASDPALASDTGIAAAAAAASPLLAPTKTEMVQQELPKIVQMPTEPDPMKVEQTPAPTKPAKAPKAPKATKTAAPAGQQIYLFIDCRPSVEHTDLYPWVEEICGRIAAAASQDDIRFAENDTAIAYGKWEGALAAMIKSVEHTPLEPGNYYLDTRGSRIHEIVAASLKARVEASGGFWARSSR